MSRAYPEIRRVNVDGTRQRHVGRHNHCRTSPVYREKCVQINTRLAERYQDHPALLVWHASNEYNGGDCHCDLCIAWFNQWLREVFGVWEEESQGYYPHESVGIAAADGNALGLVGSYKAVDTCSVIHAEGAAVLATYSDQYFAGTPALTVNAYGQGKAYYLAARTRDSLLSDAYGKLVADLQIKRVLDTELPSGVTAQLRTDGTTRFVFLLNFNNHETTVALGGGDYEDMLTGKPCEGSVTLERYGVRILRNV